MLAVKYAKNDRMRAIGMMIHESSFASNLFMASQKIFIESYFDMSIANGVNIFAFYRHHNDFKGFF